MAGEGRAAGDVAEIRGAVGTDQAGQLAPLTSSASAQVMANARVEITLGSVVTVDAEVIRAPFSLVGIAENIAGSPEYYQRLAEFADAELTREIAKYHGQGNADLVIRSELVRLQQGYAQITKHIGARAYGAAAALVISLRDGLVSFNAAIPSLSIYSARSPRCHFLPTHLE